MSTSNTGGTAFPCDRIGSGNIISSTGMTLREYASITLRVPQSGIDWLDDMIREARRMDAAEKAMPAVYSEYVSSAEKVGFDEGWMMGTAIDAYAMADAMLAASDADQAAAEEKGDS
jgi:hypothetical protein